MGKAELCFRGGFFLLKGILQKPYHGFSALCVGENHEIMGVLPFCEPGAFQADGVGFCHPIRIRKVIEMVF